MTRESWHREAGFHNRASWGAHTAEGLLPRIPTECGLHRLAVRCGPCASRASLNHRPPSAREHGPLDVGLRLARDPWRRGSRPRDRGRGIGPGWSLRPWRSASSQYYSPSGGHGIRSWLPCGIEASSLASSARSSRARLPAVEDGADPPNWTSSAGRSGRIRWSSTSFGPDAAGRKSRVRVRSSPRLD